jgi:uncharacterized protein YbjT (DUF2867 family)
MRLLLLGATGAVGAAVLVQSLSDPRIASVVAPTRRALAANPKLRNPVDDRAQWRDADWRADAVICTLGSTIAKAGSQAAFRAIDHDLVLRLMSTARAAGTRTAALVSSLGASERGNFYLRTKFDVEREVTQLGFESLTIVRPSMIDTDRNESRPAERIALLAMRSAAWLIPRAYRAVSADRIAACLLTSVAAGNGTRIIESADIP